MVCYFQVLFDHADSSDEDRPLHPPPPHITSISAADQKWLRLVINVPKGSDPSDTPLQMRFTADNSVTWSATTSS